MTAIPAGSNWLTLQKKLSKSGPSQSAVAARKRRKLEHTAQPSTSNVAINNASTLPRASNPTDDEYEGSAGNLDSRQNLRRMILGEVEYTPSQKQLGKYLSLDCEMVGVGFEGAESVLARVSLVNYHGYLLIDEFVRPRERIVDYRTKFSGIRPADIVHARPFEQVQKQVADLLKDRILVGHAVHNDLKALLLSHPGPQTRDTQVLAHKHSLSRVRCPALRVLVQQELGLTIQSGEHSSVTDARATMALFRLHRKTWEKNAPRPWPQSRPRFQTSTSSASAASTSISRKRGRDDTDSTRDDVQLKVDDELRTSETAVSSKEQGRIKATAAFPSGGRRGVSSGLSTVIKRVGARGKGPGSAKKTKEASKTKWWKDLGNNGAKGSVSLRR